MMHEACDHARAARTAYGSAGSLLRWSAEALDRPDLPHQHALTSALEAAATSAEAAHAEEMPAGCLAELAATDASMGEARCYLRQLACDAHMLSESNFPGGTRAQVAMLGRKLLFCGEQLADECAVFELCGAPLWEARPDAWRQLHAGRLFLQLGVAHASATVGVLARPPPLAPVGRLVVARRAWEQARRHLERTGFFEPSSVVVREATREAAYVQEVRLGTFRTAVAAMCNRAELVEVARSLVEETVSRDE